MEIRVRYPRINSNYIMENEHMETRWPWLRPRDSPCVREFFLNRAFRQINAAGESVLLFGRYRQPRQEADRNSDTTSAPLLSSLPSQLLARISPQSLAVSAPRNQDRWQSGMAPGPVS